MTLSRRPGPSRRVRVREVTRDRTREREDRLVTEEPLEIRLGWPGRAAERLTVTMRTPGHDFELTAGFLFGEGLIAGAGELHTVAYCTDRTLSSDQKFNVVTAELCGPPLHEPAGRYAGPTAGSSACGVCGKQSVEEVLAVATLPRAVADFVPQGRAGRPAVPAEVIAALPDRLREAQKVFRTTGGLHASALFDADGTPVVVREDVGRHNAVDKVVGSRVLAGLPTDLPVLCVSGRIGFELAQKAVTAGVGVIAAVGAPSSLAVQLAESAGLCTVGFVREDRFVVYTEHDRIGV
ncbi:MAG TPA: formate dehydrogenase accessory sulfurtransferase FdhD [Nocardioidaceae bacterium]|nr:formate dehydrogenase accessory sulfurtransferase FdhD [Nocardioidaceae bacterium]